MNELGKKLLERIQSGFPTSREPYADLASEFGVTEEGIITTLSEMKAEGIIRRIGASIDSRKAGYVSTLIGCRVDVDELNNAAARIAINPGVTHSYERRGKLNLWFTLISPDEARMKNDLDEYSRLPGMKELISMPSGKVYKIKVQFGGGN